MRTGIITYEGRHKWVLRTDELYEGQAVELDWMNFLPEGIGSRYKRARIISSSKEFLKLKIERPLRKWRDELSAGTVAGWFRMIAKKGVPFLRRLYLRLCQAAALSPNWPSMLRKLAFNAFREPTPRLAAV